MKTYMLVVTVAFCATVTAPVYSADPANNNSQTPATPATAAEVEALRQQVQSLTATVQALQQQVKDQQAAVEKNNSNPTAPALPEEADSETQTADASSSPASAASPPPLFPTTDNSVVAAAPSVNANGTTTTGQFPTTDNSVTTTSTSAASSDTGTGSVLIQPISLTGPSKNYMNISFDAMFALAASSANDLDHIEVGDHDPQQRGFNGRNAEIALDGAVDPYFEGFANIVLKLDNLDETEIELEEAFLQTSSLPFGLQVKAGQFFDAFGRINRNPSAHLGICRFTHRKRKVTWARRSARDRRADFVDHACSMVFAAPVCYQNGQGGTAYSFRNTGDDGIFYDRLTIDRNTSSLSEMLFVPRWENSFNLSDTQTVLVGVSSAFGANDTGPDSRTEIYGGDLLYKWKSARAEGGFPFVKWQTEGMYRRFEAGRGLDDSFPVAEVFDDWGMYSQLLWGFKKGWVVGLRGDYLHMDDSIYTDDITRQSRSRISANLTWYPTEFSKLRLQYNHDFLEENDFQAGRDVDSLFFQFEFILGAHGAHKF